MGRRKGLIVQRIEPQISNLIIPVRIWMRLQKKILIAMEEVRFFRGSRAAYDKLMQKESNAFYVTTDNEKDESDNNLQEEEIQDED